MASTFLSTKGSYTHHTHRVWPANKRPKLASSDSFSLLSFLFPSLSSKKWHVPRHFLSSHLTQLKQRQTTGQSLSTKHTARFFLFPTPEGQWGSRSLAPFRLRTAGLAFSRVGFANQNSTASAELSRFLGERNGRKPRRITAFWPSDVTRDVTSVTKPNSGEFLSESGNRIL